MATEEQGRQCAGCVCISHDKICTIPFHDTLRKTTHELTDINSHRLNPSNSQLADHRMVTSSATSNIKSAPGP
jgi:hypothetical protein